MGDDVQSTDASRLAEQAMKAMQARGIPPIPENFTLWYLYQSGDEPALEREIATIDEGAGGFTDGQSRELYGRYCAGTDLARQIQLVSERVSGLVEEVSGKLGTASSHTRDYGERLSTLGHGLAHDIEPNEFLALVRELESQTELMRRRAGTLETELKRNTREINLLKDDLANARRAATTDALTGLGNRKLLDDRLGSEARAALATGQPLSLMIVDIDHFKAFNDRHGHQIGDVVLKLVADRLKRSVKGRDTVTRYGGEEFVLLLPRTDLAAAATLAEQIRAEIARSRLVVRNRNQELGRVTISAGVATLEPNGTTEACFRRADRALFQAKRDGRNRIVTAGAAEACAPEVA